MSHCRWCALEMPELAPSRRSNHDDRSVKVRPDDPQQAFERLRDAIQRYDIYDPALLTSTICDPAGRVHGGVTVVQHVTVNDRTVEAANRVMEVRDEEGFFSATMGTLPGHPERGVITFSARLDGDAVTFRMQAWSEPATLLAKLLARLTRKLQIQAWDGALERMQRLLQA